MKKLLFLIVLYPWASFAQVTDTVYAFYPNPSSVEGATLVLNYTGNVDSLLLVILEKSETPDFSGAVMGNKGETYVFDGTSIPPVFFEWMELHITIGRFQPHTDTTTLYITYKNTMGSDRTIQVIQNSMYQVQALFKDMMEESARRSNALVEPDTEH